MPPQHPLPHLWESLYYSPSEGALVMVLLGSLCVDLLAPEAKKRLLMRVVGGLGAGAALLCLVCMGAPTQEALFFGHLAANTGLQYVKGLLLLAYLLSLLLFEWDGKARFASSYPILLAALALGSLFICAASSFLSMYMAMALSAVPSYLLCSMGASKDSYSVALKYALLGMLGLGALLYGFSLLYGLGGATGFEFGEVLRKPLRSGGGPQVLMLLLILLGFSFKLGAFPLHVWVPGVYSCVPLPVLAYLSSGLKIALWVLLYRLSVDFLAHPAYALLLAVWGGVGFVWATLAALSQRTLRRLLGYSSVAYAGLFLLLIAATREPLPLLFGCTFYLLAQYASVGSLIALEERKLYHMSDYQTLSPILKRQVGLPLVLALIVLSGLPPFAGFTTKFLIFSALLEHSAPLFWIICLIILLSSVWALFYYLKPLYILFLKTPAEAPTAVYTSKEALSLWPRLGVWVLIFLLLVLFLYPMPIFRFLGNWSL